MSTIVSVIVSVLIFQILFIGPQVDAGVVNRFEVEKYGDVI